MLTRRGVHRRDASLLDVGDEPDQAVHRARPEPVARPVVVHVRDNVGGRIDTRRHRERGQCRRTPQVASQSDVAAGAIGPQATPSSSIVASTDPSAGLMRRRRPVSSPTHRLPKPDPRAVAFDVELDGGIDATVERDRGAAVGEAAGEATADGEIVP